MDILSGKSNKNKLHKIEGSQYLTITFLTNPTKSGKSIRIHKGFRYLLVTVCAVIAILLYLTGDKISNQAAIITEYKQIIENNQYVNTSKDEEIESLTKENKQHYEQLQTLQVMALELEQKLQGLEEYKHEIDEKINSTSKTTNSVPEGFAIETSPEKVPVKNIGNIEEIEAVPTAKFDLQIEVLNSDLELAMASINSGEEKYEVLEEQLDEIIPYWEAYPSIMPVYSARVTSPFGYRRDPLTYVTDFHTGIDLAARYVPVVATGDGIVLSSQYDRGYGYTVVIKHGYGIITRYAHNSKLLVKKGEDVKRGDKIAISGNSGRSTGPHVHYEVIEEGQCKNPLDFLYKGEK